MVHVNDHHKLFRVSGSQDFIRIIWKRNSSNDFWIALSPLALDDKDIELFTEQKDNDSEHKLPRKISTTRILARKQHITINIQRNSDSTCNVVYNSILCYRSRLMRLRAVAAVASNLSSVAKAQRGLQGLHDFECWTDDDGIILADSLVCLDIRKIYREPGESFFEANYRQLSEW